ncbi:MAG: hypothetical protein WC071_03680 [Victivallaceae bacterium]
MIRFKTLTMFVVMLLISVVILFFINRVEKNLDNSIEKNRLRFTGQIKNAPPLVAFTTMALGSFRGVLADFLWLRTGSLQEEGNYFEMVQLASWITKLQPRFSGATAYLAWNMAYNISVTCSAPEDRWRWIQEGIKLIRDEAIEYNPEDPALYKELGWIYQHKLGNIMDDANQFYKNRIAIDMMRVFGKNPDWQKMAAAPSSEAAFKKKYPVDGKNDFFWKALQSSGYGSYDKLFQEFKDKSALPKEFLSKLTSKEQAEAIDTYFRAEWLREKYKLDSVIINQINNKYGLLDWRLAEAQAVYWATMGLKTTPEQRDIACERMITQALQAIFKNGRILMVDEKDFASIIVVPNLSVVDAVKRTFQEAYDNNEQQSTFKSAMLNFMQDAVVILFNYGNFSKSKEYYDELKKEEPDKYRRISLESFVMNKWAEDVRDASVKQATDIISGLIYRSINYMVYGDEDAALAHERIARYIYVNYQEANADIKQRVGLAPYKDIKKSIVESCLNNFPPVMAEILREKIKQEQLKAKDEEKDNASVKDAKK